MTKTCAFCTRQYQSFGPGTTCIDCLRAGVEGDKPEVYGRVLDEGIKFDDNKPRIDLFPPEALTGISTILGIGAKKYGERNWEQGMDWGRIYAANMRHLLAWWGGQENDDGPGGTGKPHLWHAGCNTAFLIAYAARGVGTDDRRKQ